ncbi:MAG TPA: NAD(P)/FAD-dependent oxidoreductase [Thermoanaerobaculia bacterium]|nr:NAD(P)/FAD-dependent oxidoreductase [Thermoanaerobaculia bacterium]
MTAHGSGEPHVVVVGGGFAGLNAARELGGTRARVTLLDRRNHHLFQPLLYQVATAALNPADVATPIRTILRKQKNTRVLLEEVSVVCPAERKVVFRDGRGMAYDYLIVATGATHSYFGHEEWARVAPGLKSIEDALEIRRRMLLAYEAAEREEDPELRGEWLTFVVIGGGPTGVELAGAFAEIALHAMRRDFRNIDPTQARIVLIEGLPRVLPTYPEDLSEKATRQLRRFGVEVRTGKLVSGIDERGATVGEERIAARTVVWAAGVQASALAKSVGAPLDEAGRVRVEPDLSVPGHPELFVVGDLAAIEQDGEPVPGVAPAAIQEGRHAARQIRRDLAGRERAPFRYRNRGSLATIGRAAAVGELGRLHLSGWPAWMAWLLIHVYFLIGFRNRLFVMLQWAWAYATQKRGARLITGDRAGEPGPEADPPRHECSPQKERG